MSSELKNCRCVPVCVCKTVRETVDEADLVKLVEDHFNDDQIYDDNSQIAKEMVRVLLNRFELRRKS